jgi:hypothetical protein
MIGINHNDQECPSRLEKYLEKIKPERILLEGSFSRYITQKIYEECLKEELSNRDINPKMAKLLLEEQVLIGYETRVAQSYCDRYLLAPLIYLNDSFDHRSKQDIEKMVKQSVDYFIEHYTPEEAQVLLDDVKEIFRSSYQLISDLLDTKEESSIVQILPNHNIHVGERDKIMERTLRRNVTEDPSVTFATITGMAHLLINPKRNSFYCRVSDLNPKRKLLID